MKRTTLTLALALTIVIVSCREQPDLTSTPPTPESSADFAKFVDEFFNAEFRFSPVSGTETGLHEYDAQLGDRTREAFEARIAELHGFLERLESLDRATFSFDDEIDAAAIEASIRGSLLNLETLSEWKTNPMWYAGTAGGAVDSLIKRDFAPASDRLASVIARLERVPAVYDAARENLTNPPREFTDLAIRMAGGSVGYLEVTVADWARTAAGDDADLFARFEAVNAKAVETTRSFASWLQSDLLPASEGDYAIGADHFLAKLRYDEMVEMPLEEILAIGEANLEKDYNRFVEVAGEIDPTKSAAEVMASLSDDHPTADDLIPSVQRTVDQARQFLVDHSIVTIPSEVTPIIAETPPYARSGSFASMDTPGAYETNATEAYYYVTPVEKEWDAKHKEEHLRLYNPYVVAMINVHEAYPGHYLQFLYAPRFPTKTRKLTYCGTNAEGWAHYTEQMMVDEGFGGGDPKYRLAQLQEALLRDVRYVVGIKLHTEGWTVEQGAKLFEEKAFQEPANAFEEARRGAYNPTYLYYTFGKLEIQKLRDEYMEKKGATLGEFHDAFVAEGGLPIPLVRKILFRE